MGAADPSGGLQGGRGGAGGLTGRAGSGTGSDSGSERDFGAGAATVVRVVTDVAGIDKEFDYTLPEGWPAPDVGSLVRVGLSGRRVGGWVVSVGGDAPPGVALRPLARVRGAGPEADVVELAGWAAWRWASKRSVFLKSASPDRAVTSLPVAATRAPAAPPARARARARSSFEPGVHVVRMAPATDPTPLVGAVAQGGPTLVVVPSTPRAAVLAGRLRRAGAGVALLPDEWAQARAGAAVVVGSRGAVWGPCPGLAAIVVVDAHEEGLVAEGAPTWSAVTVATERARRAGVPCILLSPVPTLDLLHLGPLETGERSVELSGWATVEVLDRRLDDPRAGLYPPRLVDLARQGTPVAFVLNRTGRTRLLACGACGELGRCEHCGAALGQSEPGRLDCPRCGRSRPSVCARCGSTRLKVLRVGVSRAREELEILARRPVAEVTAATVGLPDCDLLVGTEALLRRLDPGRGVAAVAFVDFDQELMAGRVRAADTAMAQLAVASRLVRGRAGRVVVCTRAPDHPVIEAARRAEPELASAAQVEWRRALGYPPFGSVAEVSGAGAGAYTDQLRGRAGIEVLSSGHDRYLVKAPGPAEMADALAGVTRPGGRLRVAVDPGRL